jgi:hypothetical protein
MWGISWLAENQLASQGLCSMEYVSREVKVKETIKIWLKPGTFNKDRGFRLGWTWQPKLKQIQDSSSEIRGQAQNYLDSIHQPRLLVTNLKASLMCSCKCHRLGVKSHLEPWWRRWSKSLQHWYIWTIWCSCQFRKISFNFVTMKVWSTWVPSRSKYFLLLEKPKVHYRDVI